MKRILLIAGTRPNFIKLAPLYHRLKAQGIHELRICHTGQHFDFSMSDVFWKLLELPAPDFMLDCSGPGVSAIIGKTVLALDKVFGENKFDLTIVFGDVNATVAGAIVSAQHRVKLMHVEAGLRSFDRNMPEEINRVLTDHISDYLMVSEPSGMINLEREGIGKDKVHFAGNIMIESLIKTRPSWERMDVSELLVDQSPYIVATFHRPENVDELKTLEQTIFLLNNLSEEYKIIFPIHPRTMQRLKEFDLFDKLERNKLIIITPALDYFKFLKLVAGAVAVITDSGGIQEETSFLNIPCITIRNNTERPVTLTEGTNILASLTNGDLNNRIGAHIRASAKKNYHQIERWDDQVSQRIAEVINEAN